MGVVYHTHYIDYFENARTEALRSIGLPYREIEESGVIMPVVDVFVRYHRPAYYDDLLAVVTRFGGIPDLRVPIDYEVRRSENDDRVASGRITLCFVDRERNRPVRCPSMVRQVFQQAALGGE